MTSIGMGEWADRSKTFEVTDGAARLGCGIGRGGHRLDEKNNVNKLPDQCNRWEMYFQQAIENGQPNVAVVQIGPWEVANRRLEGSDRWIAPGDAEYDRYMMDEMLRAIDVLTAHGAIVTWLTSPHIRVLEKTDVAMKGSAADPARMDRINELIRELPAKRPGKVEIVDLAGWLDKTGEDKRLRPDGVHFDKATATEVSERFLAEAIVRSYRKAWSDRAARGESGTTADAVTRDPAKYVTDQYKVLIVGDSSTEPVASGITAWAERTGGLKVSTFTRSSCGLLRIAGREDRNGERAAPSEECQGFRRAIIDRVTETKPDFVVVLPTRADFAELRLNSASNYATWGDAAFEKEAVEHYKELVRQINELKSVVLWANVPAGDASKSGKGLPLVDKKAAERYDDAIDAIVRLTPRKGAQRIDLARWATANVAALRDGAELNDDAHRSIGEWLAAQTYIQYDCCEKLKQPAR